MSKTLNSLLKYKFASVRSGAFYFPTDNGCEFTVSVEEGSCDLWGSERLISDNNVYKLEFNSRCDEALQYEPEITYTILDIFTANIKSLGALGVFYHVWEDKYYELGFYSEWYDILEPAIEDYDIVEYPAYNTEEDKFIITTIIIHKQNPEKTDLLHEFINAIGDPR